MEDALVYGIIGVSSLLTNPFVGYGLWEYRNLCEKTGEGIEYVLTQKGKYKKSNEEIKSDPLYKKYVKETWKIGAKAFVGIIGGLTFMLHTLYNIYKTTEVKVLKQTPNIRLKK